MIPIRTFFLASAALFFFAAPAFAHAMLERAEPAVGARVAAAPARIVLVFSESVEPMLSEIVLKNEADDAVALGKPRADGSKMRLEADIDGALAPGRYHVFWRVVSVDGHRSQGDFSFTVGAGETTL